MLPTDIEGRTRILGAPADWDPNGKLGPCEGLPILDQDGCMVSAWVPSEEEVARIVAGKPVYLFVAGGRHPPVGLAVGE
jgi:hypothetical protein